jgi:hypothetical protein
LIVAQRDFIAAVGFEAVDQLFVVADLALQRGGVLNQRRVGALYENRLNKPCLV